MVFISFKENTHNLNYYIVYVLQTVPSLVLSLGIIISTGVILSCLFGSSKNRSKTSRTLTNPNEKVALPLVEKLVISHDTRKFRFKLPSENHILGNVNKI